MGIEVNLEIHKLKKLLIRDTEAGISILVSNEKVANVLNLMNH